MLKEKFSICHYEHERLPARTWKSKACKMRIQSESKEIISVYIFLIVVN